MSDKLPACRGFDRTSRSSPDKLAACRTTARRGFIFQWLIEDVNNLSI
jgi:hypothetical protein